METFAVEANVPGGPKAASRARRLVRDVLRGRVPDAVLSDVALLVTELVANGVRHGGAHDGAELHVRFEGLPAALHVEVLNANDGAGAVGLRAPDLIGGGGLGCASSSGWPAAGASARAGARPSGSSSTARPASSSSLPRVAPKRVEVEIDGRTLSLSNLDKVRSTPRPGSPRAR